MDSNPLSRGSHYEAKSASSPSIRTREIVSVVTDESDGVVNVSKNGVTVGNFSTLNFIGNVAATDGQVGVADVDIDAGAGSSQTLSQILTVGTSAGEQSIENLNHMSFNSGYGFGLAIGTDGSSTRGFNTGVAIGEDAEARSNRSVVIGYSAFGYAYYGSSEAVVIGNNAYAAAGLHASIGYATNCSSSNTLLLGSETANANRCTAVGAGSTGALDAVVIGAGVADSLPYTFKINVSGTPTSSFTTDFETTASAGAILQYWELDVNGTPYRIPLHALA